mmetsp:Transcript_87655/g.165261  ORF Transcript_87655/g.165261 Transcript_87655/m.165261 type:complete len:277 (-) Transcript_87655:261-1091(-)
MRREPKPAKVTNKQKLAFGMGFGFIAGYTNMVCLARYSAFPTMMTGNLLMMSQALVETGLSTGHGYLPLPAFFLLIICWRHFGIFFHHLIALKAGRRMIFVTPLILCIVAAAESAKFIAGIPWIPERDNVWLVAFCFGIQSAETFPALGVPTMLATGHFSNSFFVCMEVVLREKPVSDLKLVDYPMVNITGLVLGAIAGAVANKHVNNEIAAGFLLSPITLLQAILLVLLEHLSHPERNKMRTSDLELLSGANTASQSPRMMDGNSIIEGVGVQSA